MTVRIRVAAAKEAAARGIELMTPGDLQALEAQVAGMEGDRLTLAALAEDADIYWSGKLPGVGVGTMLSLRGLYVVLYRTFSGTARPSFRGINPVVVDITDRRKRVILERPFDGRGPFGMATVIFGFALYVLGASLGWPEAGQVTAAFERYE